MKDWGEASGEPGDGVFSPVKTPLILSNQEAPRAGVEEMDRDCSRRRPPQTWNEDDEEEEVGRKRFGVEGGSRSPRRRIILASPFYAGLHLLFSEGFAGFGLLRLLELELVNVN